MATISKKNWLWFSILLTVVISANFSIYNLEMMQPVPKGIVLGSLFDFIIVIPLIAYFMIIRKRYSLKYLPLIAMAGYGIAILIIPQGLLSNYSFVKYILFAGEGALILIELYIAYKLFMKIPAILKSFRMNGIEIPTFQYRLSLAINQHLPSFRITAIIASEIAIFYYSLFSWRKKPLSSSHAFTYHQKTSVITLYVMLIHTLVLESIGLHFLLHSWEPTIAIIVLILNLYTILFFLAEIQAIRLCPFIITRDHLSLQVGVMKQLIVPIAEIKNIHYYQGPDKLPKHEMKDVFDAVLADFVKEKPTIEIEFHTPQEVKLMYGFKKKVDKAHLRPDEPQKFFETLTARMNQKILQQ